MAYALQFNGSGYVSIPAKTAGSASTDTWTAIFDLEIPNTTAQTLYAATDVATTDFFQITGSNTVRWRIGGGTTQNITLDSGSFPIDTRFLLGIYREVGRNLVITIDGGEVYRRDGVAFGAGGNAISITSIGKNSDGVLSGLVYEATIQGQNYLNTSSPDTTAWGDGTLTGIPSTNWVEYGGTPATITSTIAASIPKPTASANITVETSAITFTVAASIPKPEASASITVVPVSGDPIFTSGILHDNTQTPLISTTLLHASLYDPSTGALVLRVSSPTTNAQGRVVIQNAALSAATDYDFNCETVDGQRIMPRGTTA